LPLPARRGEACETVNDKVICRKGSLGNADIDVAPPIGEERFHAFGPGGLSGTDDMAIVRRLQHVRRFQIVQRQIFGTAFDGLKSPRGNKAGYGHAFGKMLFLIPAMEFGFVRGVDVGHEQQQPVLVRHV
jgi:hypothetical protein